MCLWLLATIVVSALAVQAQDELDQIIVGLIPERNNDDDDRPDPFTSPCGKGNDVGKRMCVPYYNCDGKTKTIISEEAYEGNGVIDAR